MTVTVQSVLDRYTLIIVCDRMQRLTSLDRLFHKVPRTGPGLKNIHIHNTYYGLIFPSNVIELVNMSPVFHRDSVEHGND